MLYTTLGIALAVLAAPSVLAAAVGHRALALGVLAGSVWNLANLWCLAHLMGAWLGARHFSRPALGWLLLKGILYGLAIWMLYTREASISSQS